MNLSARSLVGLFKRAAAAWSADNASSMGAAVAFYTLLSMAPLLVLVITLAGLFIGRAEAQQILMTQMSGLLGETGAEGVQMVLQAAQNPEGGIIATIVSLATLALGATTVFAELKGDLDRIWKAQAPKASGLWNYVRTRLLSFGLVVTIGFLLLVSLAVSAALAFLGNTLFGGAEVAMHALDFFGSIVVSTLLFAAVYKVLPSTPIAWRDVLVGAFVTAVLFWIGKFLIGLYLGKSSTASSFGAAGTVVVTILWVYYSAMIFFYGAEFTREYALSHGSRRDAANADYVTEDADMLERARRIVKGKDPVLTRRQPGSAAT
ncbi:MAG TPA: YihY/virulence factor BrkB family protein [Usitatibacter sp.]|jgi:membrane protein|nr:YihY/virulence factor BrkB family protein [Usitatibacter sp.]